MVSTISTPQEHTFNKEREDGRHVYRWLNVQQKLELHTSLTFMTYSQEGA